MGKPELDPELVQAHRLSTSFARDSEIFQSHSHAAQSTVCAFQLYSLTSLVGSADSFLCSWLWHRAPNTGSVYLICLPAHAS